LGFDPAFEPRKGVLGALVVGIDVEHVLQADAPLCGVPDYGGHPHPGEFVSVVLFEHLLEVTPGFCSIAGFRRLDACSQQSFNFFFGQGVSHLKGLLLLSILY
jgi:hypothetical protein